MQSGAQYSGGLVGGLLESVVITNLANRRIPQMAIANCGEVRAISQFRAFVLRGLGQMTLGQQIELTFRSFLA